MPRLTFFLLVACFLFCFGASDSFGQQEKIKLTFENEKETKVQVFYLKRDGTTKLQCEIDPGGKQTIKTSFGHRFQVVEESGKLKFEITDLIDQTIVLGKSHSVFTLRGWQIHLNDKLWREKPKLTNVCLDLMLGQLKRIEEAVPEKALQKIRKVPIWINPTYKGVRPTAEYHSGARWLLNNGRDPAMEKCVEITNVDNFAFENVRMPYLMLHELAHAYHDRELDFRNPEIRKRFEAAKASGKYDEVDRFTGRRIVKDVAYAISNEKEYFAESTEAFFGKNDFFPFNRQQLLEHDKPMHELVASLWGVTN